MSSKTRDDGNKENMNSETREKEEGWSIGKEGLPV